jgi:hypothetical protein
MRLGTLIDEYLHAPNVPSVTTPHDMVAAMLDLAEVR